MGWRAAAFWRARPPSGLPLRLLAAAAALTAVAAAVSATGASASAARSRRLAYSLVSPPPPGCPARMWLCAASQAARRFPGPRWLRGSPAPPRLPLAPTPRPRVTPGPRPRPGTSRGLQAGTAPPTSARGVSLQPRGRGEAWPGQEEHRGGQPRPGVARHTLDTLTH